MFHQCYVSINIKSYLQWLITIEEARDISNTKKFNINNLEFWEKGNWRGFNYQNVLVKQLMSTVQITLFISEICLSIVVYVFFEKSILVLYHYYRIQKFVSYSLSLLLQGGPQKCPYFSLAITFIKIRKSSRFFLHRYWKFIEFFWCKPL